MIAMNFTKNNPAMERGDWQYESEKMKK